MQNLKKKKARKHLVQVNICRLQLDGLYEHRERHRVTEWVRLEGATGPIHTMQSAEETVQIHSDAVLSPDTDVSPLNVASCRLAQTAPGAADGKQLDPE